MPTVLDSQRTGLEPSAILLDVGKHIFVFTVFALIVFDAGPIFQSTAILTVTINKIDDIGERMIGVGVPEVVIVKEASDLVKFTIRIDSHDEIIVVNDSTVVSADLVTTDAVILCTFP